MKQPMPAQPVWKYGLVNFSGRGRISAFEALKYFADQKWLPASIAPQPVFGNAELSASGGAPPDDPSRGIARRWVSPVEGVVEIAGALVHKAEAMPQVYKKVWGDGVRARIVFNEDTMVAEQSVNNGRSDVVARDLAVKPGDTIDFVVDCVKTSEDDNFTWSPVITLKSGRADGERKIWDAAKDFNGPLPVSLNAWEKYAQVLLETSEFAFVD